VPKIHKAVVAGRRRAGSAAVGRASVAAPFLKWAGGKRSILPAILPLIVDPGHRIETYHEPFVGGGAVFFALAALGSGAARPFRKAILADTNAELISCYSTVRSDVEGVLSALREHRDGEEYFYRVRDIVPEKLEKLTPARRAARTIYLNRNGFNGLFRVNRSGRFNVPFGKYAQLRTVSAERLRAASLALRHATLRVCDFEECVAAAGPSDFVYFDPPYVPLSRSSSFTAYGPQGFGEAEQRRLAEVLRRLGRGGVRALLSNSDCPITRGLYAGLPTIRVQVRRSINSVASGRGGVSELLVGSFPFAGGPEPTGASRANPSP
jgi:DNA adenine methylase